MKYISYLLLLFLIVAPHIVASLVEGTLVKTPNGLVPIEKLNVGDDVMSYGPHKTIKPVKILRITKEIAPSRLIIVTEQGSFVAAKDQFFYSDTYYWVVATAISDEHALLDVNSQVNQCGNSFIVNEDTTIYKVTIEFPHVLFISDLQIVTHNFLPPIAIGVSLAFGIGEGSLCTGVGLSCGALAVWKLLTGSKAAQVTLQLNNSDYHRGRKEKINTSLPSNSPEDPEDKDENDKNFLEKLKSKKTKQARTQRFGKLYQDPETRLWWSKDRTQHGNSQFKVFKKNAKGFEWVFDADCNGNRIDGKHKGPIGIFIPFKDLIGCS